MSISCFSGWSPVWEAKLSAVPCISAGGEPVFHRIFIFYLFLQLDSGSNLQVIDRWSWSKKLSACNLFHTTCILCLAACFQYRRTCFWLSRIYCIFCTVRSFIFSSFIRFFLTLLLFILWWNFELCRDILK